ncbi:MAG: carbohydrate porin [Myxococcota bacterium]|nr:carbohydrate porin [Myxococcota bacterium]
MRSGPPVPEAGLLLAWILLTLPLVAPQNAWAEPGPESGWLQRSHLTGGWGGARQALADRGVTADARYTAGFWSNVRGGLDTGTRYEGFAEWWLHAELEPLVGWKGGSFDINWYSYHGGQPSEDLVGNFITQTVSGWEAATAVRFYEILLRQTWGDGRFVVKAGQLAADTDFFVSTHAAQLLNGAFGFLGLGRSRDIAPFYPLAAPGAYFRARSEDGRWEAHAGVYTADPGSDEESNFGFDWSFDNGAFMLGELRARRAPFGLPGAYAFGVVGTTAELEDFRSGGTVDGTWGLYAVIDQLLVEQTPKRPGVGVFLRGYGAPQEDRSTANWYVDCGVVVTRPFPGRDDDLFGLGFVHLRLSDDFVAERRARGETATRRERVLEVTYRLQVTGWLSLQPDIQFIFSPAFSDRDATVVGLRAVIQL